MRIALSLSLLISIACSNTAASTNDGGPNPAVCLGANCVVVATSHFNPDFSGSGTINTVQTPGLTVTRNLDATLDPDTVMKTANGRLYVLDMDTGSLRIYDERTMRALLEIPTGDAAAPNGASFPHDFYVHGDQVYIAFAGNMGDHAIGIIDTTRPSGVTKWIPVPAQAGDTDGKPEAGNVFACDNQLYVSYADYHVEGFKAVYLPRARLVDIDLTTNLVTRTLSLAGPNAGAIAQDGADCHTVLVVTSGDQSAVPDGTSGIERVDLRAFTSGGFLFHDTMLMGRPLFCETVSPTLALLGIAFDPKPQPNGGPPLLASMKVIAVNPSAASVGSDVTGKAGFVSFVRVSPAGQLFVGAGQFAGLSDPTKLKTALYVGPGDGTRLSDTGIDLGQTPASIAFE